VFRISRYMRELHAPTPLVPVRQPAGPVVVWNLIRRCNLTCKHCYSISADKDFSGELSTAEVQTVMDDLHEFGVPVLILSGGEPLLRPDIFALSHYAKNKGFYVGLSTNGTLINEDNIEEISAVGYNYVGISLDGIGSTHDRFRRKEGAFAASMRAIALCNEIGVKVGIRFTMTQDNEQELPAMLALMEEHNIDRFYLSHLNYAGRGNTHRRDDTVFVSTRRAMELLFRTCWQQAREGKEGEFVSGNNDADGVFLLLWIQQHMPDQFTHMQDKLRQWGGNSTGVNIANIDNLGNVHPDTMWWNYNLGNVRERPFSQIWPDTSDPLMAGLKVRPRPLKGRCGQCRYLDICNGNTRVRAYQISGDYWAEDPGCYLTDAEIGLTTDQERLLITPHSHDRRAHADEK